MRHALLLIFLLACAPRYQAATLSTMAPKTRVILKDSTKVEIKQPEVRADSLFSQTRSPIPLDSVSRVEAEHGVTEGETMGAVAGAVLGVVIAWQLGAFNGSR